MNKLIGHLRSSKGIYLLLFLFFLASLFLRIYDLGQMPSGFHRDELHNAYAGRFILQNGKDIYGNSWPLLYFDTYGNYPPVLPMYLSGLSTYIFGTNVFAARFPIAVIGAALLFPLFF